MSIEIRYGGEEKQNAMKYVKYLIEKFVGEGKVTHMELNKENRYLIKFKNDQSARNFIEEIRKEFDREQLLINFEPFYKNRR